MNQQWLTTLLSKGIELEQSLRQQFQTAKDGLKTQLEERGIRLNPTDLAALIEDVSPKASHAALSYAIDMIRPFSAGMGFRISRLSDTQIEMVIPARTRNMNENHHMHEGALVTGAIEVVKLLWSRHTPVGNLEITMTKFEGEFFKAYSEDCRIRWELTESVREMVLDQLRTHRIAESEAEVGIFDDSDQSVAHLRLFFNFKYMPSLSGQKME